METIDLSKLAAPEVIEAVSYDAIFAQLVADAVAIRPDLEPVLALESEPLTVILQVAAYRLMMAGQRVNEAASSLLVAYAGGANLDHIAATQGVARLDGEDDDALRARLLLWMSGHTTAGSISSYKYWAHTASTDVRDVGVTSPNPGEVRLVVLSESGDGTPSAALLAAVTSAVTAETVRPLCDTVVVAAADIVPVTVTAHLTIRSGPDAATIIAAAEADLAAYFDEVRRVGSGVTLSGIYAALHQNGVVEVALTSPAANVDITTDQAPFCAAVNITAGLPA